MNKYLQALATIGLMSLGFLLYLGPKIPYAYALTTTTVIGWNFPNGTTLGNGIIAFIVPIIITGLFVGLPVGIGLKGGSVTFMIKLSLLMGCLITMLSLNASNNNLMPIALPIVAGIFFISYLWKGV